MRGNPAGRRFQRRHQRSIPACAGEPPTRPTSRRRWTVYPRVCGGTVLQLRLVPLDRGLSPRVRGNRRWHPAGEDATGSIPACAGEPHIHALATNTEYGLSPRVRGNPSGPPASGSSHRSIPACAGEPSHIVERTPRPRVYPRVCGGTSVCASSRNRKQGLSPRVRGNPTFTRWPPTRNTVYPRVCGGTRQARRRLEVVIGLSPRVRGNRLILSNEPHDLGSIPACAGEPHVITHSEDLGTVYPRVCGGTYASVQSACPSEGLSPRVRGNPQDASSPCTG